MTRRTYAILLCALTVFGFLSLFIPARRVEAQADWQVVTIPSLPAGAGLGKIWSRTPSDVYVWASRTTSGTADTPESFLFHWDGVAWINVLSLPGHSPGALFGTGTSEVFATAYKCLDGSAAGCGPDPGGRIYRSEDGGASWIEDALPISLGGRSLDSMSGTPGNVHLLAYDSYIFRFDGSAWSLVFSGFDDGAGKPYALSVLSPTDGYFVSCWGWGRWNGSTWTFHGIQFDFCDAYSLWGQRDGQGHLHLYAAGSNNFQNGVRVWRFDEVTQSFGSKFGFVFSDGNGFNVGSANGIWGSGPNDIYVIGRLEPEPNDGRLYHFDGITWQQIPSIGPIPRAGGIWGTNPGDVWVSLTDGRLLHYGSVDPTPPAMTSSGHVADVNNNPVAGVLIADGAGHTAITDTNGNYTLSGLAAGTYTLTPSKSGYTFVPTSRVVSVPPNSTAQDFTATATASSSVSGRIADASSVALADVTVSDGAGHTATTDVNGNYTLQGLSDGLHVLTPSKVGYTFIPATRTVSVPPDVSGLNFFAIPTSTGSSSISGRVADAANRPLGGVVVSDDANHGAITDTNGNYTLRNLAPGSYIVSAMKPGYRFSPPTRVIRVPSDAIGQNFVATPINSGGPGDSISSSVSGRIIDNLREAPMSGVTISDGVGHTAVTDANGNYTLGGLTRGTYSLIPSKSGYSFTPATRSVTVPPGITGQNFVARLAVVDGFSISGHVLDNLREAPVSGVTISDGAGHTATTDASGNYTLSGLAARAYTLTPVKAGYTFSPTTRQASVPPNASGQNFLAIVNDPGNASISGRITDVNNVGIVGISISDNAGHTAVTNSAGQYSLTGLAAGLYTITPSKTGYSFTPPSRTIQLERSAAMAGYTFSATPIPVPGQRGSIAGTVSVNGIGPAFGLAGAIVQACRAGAATCAIANSANQGAYTVSNLEAGLYTLRAFVQGGFGDTLLPVEIGPISLAAGQTITGQNLVFGLPLRVPTGVTFAGAGPGTSLPSISRIAGPYQLTAKGCAGATATYSLNQGGFILVQNGAMTEKPAGTYTAMVGPLARSYSVLPPGRARLDITIRCPGGGNPQAYAFDIYIDPSGVVKTVDGNLIVGAAVTVFRSDSPGGPFDAVPDGSALMSPSNRRNPTLTDANGAFSWDVVAGFYKLRAEKAGCVSPSDAAQPYAESAVLTIPPPVTDLDIRLSCESTPPASSALISPKSNAAGWNKANVTVTLSAIDNVNGAGVKELTYSASGAQPIPTTTVNGISVSIPITVEGETMISYFAADTVDNIEPAHTIVVKLDKTAPQLIVTSPQPHKYLRTTTFTSNWSANDGLAQVSSIAGKLDGKNIANGQVIDVFFLSLGKHTITVKASDHAGNRATASVSFRVVADIDSLIAAERRACQLGWISSKAECRNLESKLQKVRSDIDDHKFERAERRLKAFLQRLDAQLGKTVNKQSYELLSGDARYVMRSFVDDD
jgi:hypothetical protein